MITTWNISHNLPTTLAESIAGYNKLSKTMWIVGGWNGSSKMDTLWRYNTSTHQFKQENYKDKQKFTAESYTSKGEYIYFTDNYKLYQFAMTSNPNFQIENNLSINHNVDRPSITTDQVYLYLTGGIDKQTDKVVNTLSIYDITHNNWINLIYPSMNYPRLGHNCIARNNYLYVFGGYINDQQKLYIGDVDGIPQQNWTLLNHTLDNAIAFMRIAEVNGLIYIIGGYSEDMNSSVNTVNILDPTNDKVIAGVSLTVETNRPAVTVDAENQQIYIFGGHETWESATALDITQKSNKITQPKNMVNWLLYTIFGSVGLFLCISFVIFYKLYGHCYKQRGEIGERERKNSMMRSITEEAGISLRSYGAAEGMDEGREYRLNSADKPIAGGLVDTAAFQSLD